MSRHINVRVAFRTCLTVLAGMALAATGVWASPAAEEAPAAAMEKEMVMDPSTGEMVTAPEYGGTLTYVFSGEPNRTDAWFGAGAGYLVSGVIEKLGIGNWAIDRDVLNFHPLFIPESAFTGLLAESWSRPDPLTYVFKIRQGVHWHNKAPMNGRELTAEDIEYNFHRYFGLGEFSEAGSTNLEEFGREPIESVTATDKWTVVMKLNRPSITFLSDVLNHWGAFINPPEVIEQHGDVNDWQNVVGTGPYELTDFVEGSSFTHTKNPEYWRNDEKYPENRLPYIDELKALLLKEKATYLAALRSGRVDHLGFIGGSIRSEVVPEKRAGC